MLSSKVIEILDKYNLTDCDIYSDNMTDIQRQQNTRDICVLVSAEFFDNMNEMLSICAACMSELNQTITDTLYFMYRYDIDTDNDTIVITTKHAFDVMT